MHARGGVQRRRKSLRAAAVVVVVVVVVVLHLVFFDMVHSFHRCRPVTLLLLLLLQLLLLSWTAMGGVSANQGCRGPRPIPTTMDGPFLPVTRRFDPSLRRGSDDLPMDHPRLAKRVHTNFPEQIALAVSSPTSMWVSWVTGDAQVGTDMVPVDPTSVRSEVMYGIESGRHDFVARGLGTVYTQLYPFQGLQNYTSAIIHHVRIQGLEPGRKYYYKCGDSYLQAMSEEKVFQAPPRPPAYPYRIGVIGDLGLTRNSTTTIDHLIQNDPSLVLMVGDMCYADQYRTTGGKGVPCFSCAFPDAPIRETYQPRWDGRGRFPLSLS